MATKNIGKPPRCKYWKNCYRKDLDHRKQFFHPEDLSAHSVSDSDDEDSAGKHNTGAKGSSVDLKGKKIVFTGALAKATRKQAASQAMEYGCIVAGSVSKNTDLVIVGSSAGQKADKAEALGVKVISEDDWEELLAQAKPVGENRTSTRKKNKAAMSDSSDEDYEPPTQKKKTIKNKKQTKRTTAHDVSASDESDDDVKMATPKKKTATKRAAPTHDVSDSGSDDDVSPSPKKKKRVTQATNNHAGPSTSDTATVPDNKQPKCKYWKKCYRKDKVHLNTYKHPAKDAETDDMDIDDDEEEEEAANQKDGSGDAKPIKAKHDMADGETVDVADGKYRIKRTGDHYYCTCLAWKNQKNAVDSRTCKHLKEYLGEEFEKARLGGGVDSGGGRGAGASSHRAPKQKAIPQLLLAHKWTESTNPTGWWLSEKLDGVRAYWDGKTFYSRLGNEFVPPAWFIKDYPADMELDGELFGGRGKFQSTVSIVKSQNSERWKAITFQVFDAPHIGHLPFEKRMAAINKYFEDNSVKTVEVLKQEKCQGKQHIQDELQRVEGLGGEGLMIRQPGSKYVNGRSSTLLKIKTFHDAEARVIGHERGKGKYQHMTGALRCEMECGKQFSVGSGMTDKDRAKPPKIGSIITYKFQELTNDGVPRFPTYIGVRLDADGPKDAVLPKKAGD